MHRNKLNDFAIKQIVKPGVHCDGEGLYLQITRKGSRSWLLRYQKDGRARAMGIGPLSLISLAEARKRARAARLQLLDGVDPIDARKEQKLKRKLEVAQSVTFKMAAEKYLAAHAGSWKNAKHRAQWTSTLATYVYPVIGDLPVGAIDTALVVRIVEPLWLEKPETGSRVRGRIEAVLDWAAARELRSPVNPARFKGHLAKLLPATRKIARVKHHPALPYADLPRFYQELGTGIGSARLAMKFLILTAARTTEVLEATWREIQMDAQVRLSDGTFRPCPTWVLPPERMKSGREHRVPLSPAAVELLRSLPRVEGTDYLFPGARSGRPLSNMALLELMRGMRPGYVPHGLRSTFRDWVLEASSFSGEVAEAALAHVSGDATERAYKRGDALGRRQDLMTAWAEFANSASAL